MKYNSTRGGAGGFTFEEALLSGYASDGGILMPDAIPEVTKDKMKQWAKLSYKDLVKEIVGLFVSEDEIPQKDMSELIDRAFSSFTHPDVVTLNQLSNELNVLELFHGKTLAFKDLALSCVGQFLEYFLNKRQKHVTIVVGTSGDTGSASIESVRGLKWVDLVVLLPKGRCARIQELQMTTVIEENIHIFRVDGTSDDIDDVIKPFFLDHDFVAKHRLCSINSINWARVLVQIAHYFYAYLKVCPECNQKVEIIIPTGACGNVTGGCIAVQMGLPVKLVCAVNVNDIVSRTLSDGDFSVNASVQQTLAPAMDIQVPYNFERILYLFSNRDTKRVRHLLEEFESKGSIMIPMDLQKKISGLMSSCRVEDAEIQEAMRRCWRENQYLLCPHTATAAHYHYMHTGKGKENNVTRVCIATASPAKFEEAVTSAGLTPQPTKAIEALSHLPTKYVDMEVGQDWKEILKGCIEDIYMRKCI